MNPLPDLGEVQLQSAELVVKIGGTHRLCVNLYRCEPQCSDAPQAVYANAAGMPPQAANFASGTASPFPADPLAPQPQVSGKLGDGKLLGRLGNLIKLAVELGLIKPLPFPLPV